jgi:hypothetical protein
MTMPTPTEEQQEERGRAVNSTERISGGASSGTPTCSTCPHLDKDKSNPGWGWCNAPQNRVMDKGWVNGFTPSQSPSGSCELHPERTAGVEGRTK